MENQNIRIHLKALIIRSLIYQPRKLLILPKGWAQVKGPIPLPTRIERYTFLDLHILTKK